RPARSGAEKPPRRSAHLFQTSELRWPTLALLLCVFAGQLCWQWVVSSSRWSLLDPPPQQFGMRDTLWRLFSLTWLLGVGAILVVGAGGIMRLYRLSGDEGRMLTLDALWLETRGEQRRINRWLAWLRRKRGRKLGELQ